MDYSISRILVTLWVVVGLGWTTGANAHPPLGSLAEPRSNAIESECVRALSQWVPGRPTTYGVPGGWVDVTRYCKAYASGRVFSMTYSDTKSTVEDPSGARRPCSTPNLDAQTTLIR